VPGHPDEVAALLRAAARSDDRVYIRLSEQRNPQAFAPTGKLHIVRAGSRGTVIVVGPLLDPVLAATTGLDVTVAYTMTPRPLDTAGLRAVAGESVVMVEPYLAGTSSRVVAAALSDRPHRALHLGVGRAEVRHYGKPADHARAHGLDAAGLRASITAFLENPRDLGVVVGTNVLKSDVKATTTPRSRRTMLPRRPGGDGRGRPE
jgi:transketolase